jgi:DNA polymerase/3'-5' exonuclease PolX
MMQFDLMISGFPTKRREILKDNFRRLQATIVDDVWQAKYIVISDAIRSLSAVAKRLHVSEEQLKRHLDENTDIRCVYPKWVDSCIAANRLTIPGRDNYHTIYTVKRNRGENGDNVNDSRKKTANQNNNTTKPKRKKFPQNLDVASKFSALSKLHKTMPLLKDDHWKSYQFRLVAGRIANLDFEVDTDFVTQKRLRSITGFGESVCEKIQECLSDYGTIRRIHEFENDDDRNKMKNIIDIWGVGRIGALDLINQGCKTIHDVRRKICNNELSLDRNQLVGVDCYEDIQHRIDRSEVESLAEVVRLAAEKLFPGIQVYIMGSYRRGKESCGDVDIHLTHPTDSNFAKTIPNDALGRIIGEFFSCQFKSYELTISDVGDQQHHVYFVIL